MRQVAQLRRKRIEVIWVTSGAIASATPLAHAPKVAKKRSLAEKQALSAIGQPMLMGEYNKALRAAKLSGGQVLLTWEDLARSKQRKNFANTMEQLLKWGITPILNENDATATEEIRFGDNDSLSAKVAKVMRADRLVILTDVEGLFDSDPKSNPNARLIHTLDRVSSTLLSSTEKRAGSSRGTGGMYSKLKAAQEATQSSIETWLVKGDVPNILPRVARNERIGTRFKAAR
jgi:glutamate 5-kinase